MKKLIILTLSVLLLSACNAVRVDNYSYDEIIDEILIKEEKPANVYFGGYKYYLPKGIIVRDKKENNLLMSYEHQDLYMYTDLVAYYHKTDMKYSKAKDIIYSRNIENKSKKGYLEIREFKDDYYYEYSYNYSKIEGICSKKRIRDCLIKSSQVLGSVVYNDTIIESLIGKDAIKFKEKSFDIFEARKIRSSDTLYYEETSENSDVGSVLKEDDFLPTEQVD